jgi:acetyl esterase/lipase
MLDAAGQARVDRLRDALRANAPRPGTPLEQLRRGLEQVAARLELPPDVQVVPGALGGVGGEWLLPTDRHPGRALLYLHGGGYVLGSPAAVRPLAAGIARASRAAVFVLDYRLAPENPFPAAVLDAEAAYRALVADGSSVPAGTAVIGESAGGGLAVAALLALRDSGGPMPAAAVSISPLCDLRMGNRSSLADAGGDPMVPRWQLELFAALYLAGADPADPLASPVCADLRGLPELLVQAGEAEALFDDACALAAVARRDGVPVTFQRWPSMPHIWHIFAPALPQASEAIEDIGAWLQERLVA